MEEEIIEWGILDGSVKVMICWIGEFSAKVSNGEQNIFILKSRLTF